MSLAKPYRNQAGLTLVEVLISLAIIGIAMTAVIKSTSQNIHSTGYIQSKTAAMWVGQQVINEARAGALRLGHSSSNQKLTMEMLGHEWYWQAEEEETSNTQIKKITVKVFANENDEAEENAVVTLEGYVQHEAS